MAPLCQCLCTKRAFYVISVSGTYCGLNIALNYFNAFLFGSQDGQRDLDTPFFYSFVNFFLSTLAWTPFLFFLQGCVIGGRAVSSTLGFVSWRSFRRFWFVLLMLSCCNVVSITAQNASLVSIPLTINQLLKALAIIPMLFLSCLIEGKHYSSVIVTTLCVQLAGALMAAFRWQEEWTGEGSQTLGYIEVSLSVFSSAIRPVLVGYIYAAAPMEETGFSPVTLVWYDAVFATCGLLPFVFTEAEKISELYAEGRGHELWGYTVAGSTMALLYNLIVFVLVREISSIGYMALAQFNTVVVVGGAILLVDHLSSVLVWAGTIMCLLASTAYVCIRWLEEGDQLLAAPAAAPPATRPADDEPSAEDGGLRSSDLKPSAPTEATPLKGSLADAPAPSASSGGCALQ